MVGLGFSGAVVVFTAAGAAALLIGGFAPGPMELLAAAVLLGRAAVVLAEPISELRGVVLEVVVVSAVVRELRGRLAAAVALAGVMVDRRSAVVAGFPGDALAAAAEDSVVRRAVGFLFSSPEVMEPISTSASDGVERAARPVLRAVAPMAGRVGGLLSVEPVVPARAVALAGGRAAAVGARAVVEDVAAGRRVLAVEVLALAVDKGRRTEPVSGLEAVEEALEAILRRAVPAVPARGAAGLFGCGASAGVAGAAGGPCAPCCAAFDDSLPPSASSAML